VPALDYTGSAPGASGPAVAAGFAIAAIALLGAAMFARTRALAE
jgi:hypothetical protein